MRASALSDLTTLRTSASRSSDTADGLVDDDDVGELDLLHQQIDEGAVVLLARDLAAVAQEIIGAIVLQQARGVDDGDHRVEPRQIGEAGAILVAKGKGAGDRQRLGDARALDQQIIEAAVLAEAAHLLEQIVAQGAADAAIGHFDELLVGSRQLRAAVADEIGVDIHLAHIVHDDGDAPALAIIEDMIEQGRLSGPEEAGEDGDGKAKVGGLMRHGAPYVML